MLIIQLEFYCIVLLILPWIKYCVCMYVCMYVCNDLKNVSMEEDHLDIKLVRHKPGGPTGPASPCLP